MLGAKKMYMYIGYGFVKNMDVRNCDAKFLSRMLRCYVVFFFPNEKLSNYGNRNLW